MCTLDWLRFRKNIQIGEGPCWLWIGSKSSKGYGHFWLDGSPKLAHRISWAVFNKKPFPEEMVLHSCDVPACVNPDHLSLGDAAENARQAVERGRAKNLFQRGEKHRRWLKPRMTELKCMKCGTIFFRFKSDIKVGQFCSKQCWYGRMK